jgi:hypothetical protein
MPTRNAVQAAARECPQPRPTRLQRRSEMRIRRPSRDVLRWAQNDRCLVCDFPLSLGCHLHHVIARDDLGPDHPLNLIGLCPNHHEVIETGRRHVSPRENSFERRVVRTCTGGDKGSGKPTAATASALRHSFNSTHKFRNEIRGIETIDPKYRALLAFEIAPQIRRCCYLINKARPRLLLIYEQSRGVAATPTRQEDEDSLAQEAVSRVRQSDFARVVELHLTPIGLLFDPAWLEESPE